jgi:hypothetical protein
MSVGRSAGVIEDLTCMGFFWHCGKAISVGLETGGELRPVLQLVA